MYAFNFILKDTSHPWNLILHVLPMVVSIPRVEILSCKKKKKKTRQIMTPYT